MRLYLCLTYYMGKTRYKYTDEELKEAVKASSTWTDVLGLLGVKLAGGNYTSIKNRVMGLGFDTSHFNGDSKLSTYAYRGNKLAASEILILRSGKIKRRTHAYKLRRALIESGVPYRCVGDDCGLEGVWKGKVLILQVDHINGDWMDDRKENLEFRCPNCHSQTIGYAGMIKDRVPADIVRPNPKRVLSDPTERGNAKHFPPQIVKGRWPTAEGLKLLVWQKPATEAAKDIGVSSTAVKKRCKELGIQTPGRGYWARQKKLIEM